MNRGRELVSARVRAIPKSSPTYIEAAILLTSLQEQHRRIAADAVTKSAQSQSLALQQMFKNRSGEAHDPFTCANSTENKPIMPFDGSRWWTDDERCAAQLQAERDADAESSSYWPTTLRVDTDSFSRFERRMSDSSPGQRHALIDSLPNGQIQPESQ
jgi:type II secretory pathway pseudopilin PulG